MRLIIERRAAVPGWATIAAPLVAVLLTLIAGAMMFAAMGHRPLEALSIYFLSPLADVWALQEIAVKAAPLVLIATGLSLCYLSNNWNIGAEGQLVAGAILGGWVALATHGMGGAWILPAMLIAGMVGGALWALVPALMRVRFGASEILTSLMLVYVAELLLDWLVRGPWRNPRGFGFPQSVNFDAAATIPALLGDGGRLNLGAIFAVAAVIAAAIVVGRTLKGFEIRLVGEAPRAARFAGFDAGRTTLTCSPSPARWRASPASSRSPAPIGQLQPSISPGYGFTAIIVAFLGRLNPIGALVAGLFLALTFIGGENAQIAMRIPLDVTRVFQGLLLFFVLGCDTFLLYRLRLVAPARAA
jgi:ABC-type uncharacterized transport system permease subunit